jgi:hypothetical protein
LFLGGFDLTPTFREVNKKYSTRYYLSLVLIDEGTRWVDQSMYFNADSTQMPDDTSNNPKLYCFGKHPRA